MQPLLAVKSFFEAHPTLRSKRLLLALSGGADSMALLHILHKLKFDFEAAHCNYQLRGKESNDDENLVKQVCTGLKIKLHIKRFDTNAFCEKQKVGIQEGARILRYEWFEHLIQNNNFDFLTTAHHKDDVAETYLFNLLRGTGINGLQSILPIRDKLIRPMLKSTKNDVLKFISKNKIPFREDSSNKKNIYARNHIRNKLIPALAEIEPDIVEQLSASAKDMQELVVYKNKLLQQFVNHFVKDNTISLCDISVENLFILKWHLLSLGFNAVQCESILNSKHGNSFYNSEWIIFNNRNTLFISEKEIRSSSVDEIKIERQSQEIFVNNVKVSFEFREKIPTEFSRGTLYLDADKLQFPLTLRLWQKGDRIIPFGMRGTKLISDLLTDLKISGSTRNNVYVLVSNNKIAAVVGIRSSDEFKIGNKTRSIFLIK